MLIFRGCLSLPTDWNMDVKQVILDHDDKNNSLATTNFDLCYNSQDYIITNVNFVPKVRYFYDGDASCNVTVCGNIFSKYVTCDTGGIYFMLTNLIVLRKTVGNFLFFFVLYWLHFITFSKVL